MNRVDKAGDCHRSEGSAVVDEAEVTRQVRHVVATSRLLHESASQTCTVHINSVDSASGLGELNVANAGADQTSSSDGNLLGSRSVGKVCDLTLRLSVLEVASEIMADSGLAIDSDNQLRLGLMSSEHFERQGLVEQVGAVWNCGVGQEGNVVSSERRVCVTDDLSLTDVLMFTSISDVVAKAVLRIGKAASSPHLNLIVQLGAASLHDMLNS